MTRKLISAAMFVLLFASAATAAGGGTARQRISAALDHATDLGRYEIDIEGRAGLVILTGEVGSSETKRRIGEIASQVAYGDEVRNQLTINEAFANVTHKGSELEHGISQALAQLRASTVFKVNISIHGDAVDLRGDAATPEDIARIVDAIHAVPGVKTVTNNLIIVPR